MNPFVETWVRAIKGECLDHFMVFGEEHLKYLVDEYLVHHNEERPHQGVGNRWPKEAEPLPELVQFRPDEVVCHERLGGLLKHYERRAA
jgi:putative transposase